MPTLEDDDWDLDGQGEQVRPYQDWDMERDIDDLDEEFGGYIIKHEEYTKPHSVCWDDNLWKE